MNVKGVIIFANVLSLLMSQVGFAQEITERQEIHQELEMLKEQQGLIYRELKEIKALLAERGIGSHRPVPPKRRTAPSRRLKAASLVKPV